MKLRAKVDISRWMRGDSGDIEIVLRDELSGVAFASIEIDFADFARATILSRAAVPAKVELRGTEYLGCVRENKTEHIHIPGGVYADGWSERIEAAIKPFEVDGWVGSREDARNQHCSAGKDTQKIGFRRYVRVLDPLPSAKGVRVVHGTGDTAGSPQRDSAEPAPASETPAPARAGTAPAESSPAEP
jgi:hypothetical protein